jgi:WD40 repeat protein
LSANPIPRKKTFPSTIFPLSSAVFAEYTDSVEALTFRKELLRDASAVFASGASYDTAILYHDEDSADPTVFPLRGHSDSITALSFSPDGSILTADRLSILVFIWDPTNSSQIAQLTGPQDSIEWISKHATLAAVDRTGFSWLWNANLGKCSKVYAQAADPVTGGGFQATGSLICTAGDDWALKI